MIDIECDNCEKVFEASPDDAGGKVPCPHCGDVNRIPKPSDPVSLGLPAPDAKEADIISFRPAMFRARPITFTFMLAIVVGGIAGAILAWQGDTRWLVYVGLAGFVIGGVWWAGWYINHLSQRIRITNKRTIHRRGLLRKHTNEVLHNHVRNLQIEQSFWQRLGNTGKITLDSSAGGGSLAAEIQVDHVPRPHKIKELIDQYRDL